MFPAETVPDGAAFAPHHLTWGVLGGILVCAIVWDNYRRVEPIITAVGLVGSFFSFLFIWPYYPEVGAAGSLVALLVALGGLFRPKFWWKTYKDRLHIAAVVFTLIAIDDIVSHAFGIWTPVDWVWKEYVLFLF